MPMPQTVVEQLPMEMKGNNLVSRRLHSKEISKEQVGSLGTYLAGLQGFDMFWPFIIPPYDATFKDWEMTQASKDSIHGTRLGSFLDGWLNRSDTDVSGMWYLFLATMVVIPVGYGSIPLKIPFLGEWTSILTQLFWCELQGYKVLTHCQFSLPSQQSHKNRVDVFSEVFAALWDTNISWFFGGLNHRLTPRPQEIWSHDI